VEVVASLSQGRTAAAQCGLFTHKSVPVIFEPPCNSYPQQVKVCINTYERDTKGPCKLRDALTPFYCLFTPNIITEY